MKQFYLAESQNHKKGKLERKMQTRAAAHIIAAEGS